MSATDMSAVRSVDQDVLRMLSTMLRLVRTVDAHLRGTAVGDLGLTDLGVLAQIQRGIDLPSSLADVLRLDRPRVTRVTDRLVTLGYVEREIDEEDRRRCRLSLTPAGQSVLHDGLAAVSRTVDSILAVLSGDDRDALLQSLAALRPALDALPTPTPRTSVP